GGGRRSNCHPSPGSAARAPGAYRNVDAVMPSLVRLASASRPWPFPRGRQRARSLTAEEWQERTARTRRFFGSNSKRCSDRSERTVSCFIGEFDPGSGQTLAACIKHASRTDFSSQGQKRVENG